MLSHRVASTTDRVRWRWRTAAVLAWVALVPACESADTTWTGEPGDERIERAAAARMAPVGTGEELASVMRRRIQFALYEEYGVPPALASAVVIPDGRGGHDVWARFSISEYERCMHRERWSWGGRATCLDERTALTRDCVTVGAVLATFGAPRGGKPWQTSGALTVASTKFERGTCYFSDALEFRVHDVDGDSERELHAVIETYRSGVFTRTRRNDPAAELRHLYIVRSREGSETGEHTLEEQQVLSLGHPSSVEYEDANGDGYPDLVEKLIIDEVACADGTFPCFGYRAVAHIYDPSLDRWHVAPPTRVSGEPAPTP